MTILLIILPILILSIGIFLLVYITSKSNKEKQTHYAYTQGKIVELHLEETPYVVIQYNVHSQTYQLNETLNTKEEKIQVGQVTVGTKRVPAVPAEVGRTIVVQYNIKDPTHAFWVANTQCSS